MFKNNSIDSKFSYIEERSAELENIKNKKKANNYKIKHIFKTVADFIKKKERICYGGLALNEIIKKKNKLDAFYNDDEIPDYDFFSPQAKKDAVELSDLLEHNNISYIQAKNGLHDGTFKIFAEFIPVADITQIEQELFNTIKKDSHKYKINGIYYASPNYLRMSLYLELSRPKGDVSRWVKIYKRKLLLDKNYPYKKIDGCIKTIYTKIKIPFNYKGKKYINYNDIIHMSIKCKQQLVKKIMFIRKISTFIRKWIIKNKLVIFGSFATFIYLEKDIENIKLHGKGGVLNDNINEIFFGEYDILSNNYNKNAKSLINLLNRKGYKTYYLYHRGLSELIPDNIEIGVIKNNVQISLVYIYKSIACHSYNIHNNMKLATIYTMLNMFYGFFFHRNVRIYYDKHEILCNCNYLIDLQERYIYATKGIMNSMPKTCYGKQIQLEEIRKNTYKKKQQFKKTRKSKDSNYFYYQPDN